jgi:hypothetical protein
MWRINGWREALEDDRRKRETLERKCKREEIHSLDGAFEETGR